MCDLYDIAVKAWRERTGEDWKADLKRHWQRYEAAETDEDRRRIEDDITRAFLPMAAFLAMKQSYDSIGYDARSAFEYGLGAVGTSIRRFDPAKNKVGSAGFLSYIAQNVEWDMLEGKRRQRRKVDAHICSLDALEDIDCLDSLVDTSPTADVMSKSVGEVLGKVMCEMSPVDRWITCSRIAGDSWEEISRNGREIVGSKVCRHTWSDRFNHHVLPRIQAALYAAGYDGSEFVR